MKKICSILILIVLLLNSSLMILISQAVDAVSEMISSEKDEIQSTQEVVLEKYVNYANELEKGTIVQLRVGVGLKNDANKEVYVKDRKVSIECPRISEKVPTRVEIIGKEAKYENGTITIQESYENKLKYEGREEYTVILFYDADCYTENQEERMLNEKVLVEQTIETAEAKESVTVKGEATAQIAVRENVGTIVSVDYETGDIYNGYINSNIENGTAYDTEYQEKNKVTISNKNIAESFIVESNDVLGFQGEEIQNNRNLLYKGITLEKEDIKDILGANGEIRILNEENRVLEVINNEIEAAEDGKYTYNYQEPVEKIKLQIINIEKEGIIEFNTTKIIKGTLTQNVDLVKNRINVVGTKTTEKTILDEENKEEKVDEITIVYEENNLETVINIQNATQKISMDVNKKELTNNVQNNMTITATLEKNTAANRLFENPTVIIELPEEVEKVILNDVQVLHDLELSKQEAVVETNAEGKKVIRIALSGKQTQYTQQEDITKGTNILISATVMLKQNIQTKTSSIKMICNENVCEQEIKVIEKNQVVKKTTSKTEAEGTVVNQNGLKIATKVVAGDKILANNETIYEQQIIKYEVKVTNTTENNIENVKIVGKVPEGMTYVDLVVGGFYDDNYDFIPNTGLKQKEIEVGTLSAGQTETYYYEVKVNDLADTEQEKIVNSEIKVYIGENEISVYTLENIVQQGNIAVELKGLPGRSERNERIYFAKVSNIAKEDLQNVVVNIPFSANIKVKNVQIWGKEEGEYEKTIENNNVFVKFSNIQKLVNSSTLDKDGTGGIGFVLEENEVGIYITANLVNVEEDFEYIWEINTAATVTTSDGNIYKSNENRASGYIEAVKVTQESDKSGEELQVGEEITYTLEVENIGNVIPEWGEYTKVKFIDYIPNELEITSVEYNTFIITEEHRKYTITPKDFKFVQFQINEANRKDNTSEPRISLDLNIPLNEKSIITIKAKVRTTYSDIDIENYAMVTGENIKTKQSNSIQNKIKGYKGTTIVDPDDPNQPINPDNPNPPVDPDNPNPPTEKGYTISGIAWVDENENGQREEIEQRLLGIEVLLLDITNNKYLQDNNGRIITKTTNNNGQYSFENVKEGKYYVVFKYNNDDYELTTYKKPGISAAVNSDAMQREALIDGKNIYVGITDIIDVASNKENIDIGLVKNKIFDLKVDKYIEKITVQNAKGTKQYTYKNEKIAKVEIPAKQIAGSILVVEYKIVVTNVGELAGTVNELIDKMPAGLEFKSELNSNWYKTVGNNINNTSLSTREIKPGESIETSIVLTKTLDDTIQTYTNVAKIGISDNSKHINDKNVENDTDKVDIIISINTGTIGEYIGTIIATLLIITVMLMIVLIIMKRFPTKNGIKLFILLGLILTIIPMTTNVSVGEDDSGMGDGFVNISRDPITGQFNGGQFHCESPGLAMCNAQHPYQLVSHEVIGEPSISGDISCSASVDLNKTATTIKYKEVEIVGQGKYKVYGPFKMTCTSDGSPSYSLSVTGMKVNSTVPENIDYTLIDANGSTISLAPGIDFYLRVPTTVEALVSVNATAHVHVTFSYTATVTVKYYYECNFVNICSWCASRPKQTLSETKDEQVTVTGSADATDSISWSEELPKTLKIKKVDYDNNSKVLPNVKFVLKKTTTTTGTGTGGTGTIHPINPGGIGELHPINPGQIEAIQPTNEGELQQIDTRGGVINSGVIEEIKPGGTGTLHPINPGEINPSIPGGSQGGTTSSVTYVKQDPNDLSISYVDNEEDATVFITDANGIIQVEGLSVGSYTFIEKEIPYHGYNHIKNLNSTRTYTVKGTDHLIVYQVKNKEMLGTLDIEKQNNVNSTIKLSNVEFVLLDNTGTKYLKVQVEGKEGFQTGTEKKLIGTTKVTKQEYTDKYEEATIFVTDANGKIHIEDLELQSSGTNQNIETDILGYVIKEIHNPHYGYEVDSNYITWKVNGSDITGSSDHLLVTVPNKGTTNVIVKNEQKYVRISGYVYEDVPNGKDNIRNELYDTDSQSKDKLVEGIRVRLRNSRTGAIYENWTNSKGAYLFGSKNEDGTYSADNILLRDINNYYVEFIYNGMKYTNVAPQIDKNNGSKAIEGAFRESFNNKYATITGNTAKGSTGGSTGKALNVNGGTTASIKYTQPEEHTSQVTYTEGQEYANKDKGIKLNDYYALSKYHISSTTQQLKYGLGTTYVADNEEIKNINLGIFEREQVDLAISSDIEEVNVSLHGYTNTYNYAARNQYVKNKGAFRTGVKFGDKYLNRYSRTIYQSAVTYFAEDRNNNKLEVNVLYKVTLYNNSPSLASIFKKINNYYDKEYTPQEVYYVSKGTKTPITTWKIGNQTYANGRLKVLQVELPNTYLSAGETAEVYIRYKVSDDTVLGLMNQEATLQNMTEIDTYSTFTKISDTSYAHYASIDENSAPGNVVVELDANDRFIKTTFEDDTDMAPSLKLQSDKNNIISGTVFEDSQTQASKNKNERLGNGIYEQNERVVEHAKVELLEVYDSNDNVSADQIGRIKYDSNGNPIIAKLYQFRLKENGTTEGVLVDAVTYTDNKGNYQLIGLIPDGYAVRYTYGQGTKIQGKEIDARDYKSTIITSGEIRKALNIQADSATIEGRGNLYWNTIQEKDGNGNIIRYSDAADEILERIEQEQEDDSINYATLQARPKDMKARTAAFIVGVEFENINSASDVYFKDMNGNIVMDEATGEPKVDPNFYSENKNMDFGIIYRPVIDIKLDKNLTNMSIQLGNGQMLVNGNPYQQDLPYTKAIEDSIYVDMDADLIQGAALKMEYEIKLVNASEVDYKYTTFDAKGTAGRRYYYFGDSTGAEKIDKYVKLVGDYLDDELVYNINEMNQGLPKGWTTTTAQKLYEEGRISQEVRDVLISEKENILTTTEFSEGLGTSSNPNIAISKTIRYQVSKLLGARDELVFTNDAEILELYAVARRSILNTTPGNLIPQHAKEQDEDSVSLTIMPPTGGVNYSPYIIATICSLTLIMVGVILIRRKMLRTDK